MGGIIMKNSKGKKGARVTPAMRQDWLRRYEDGETPRDIANSQGVDHRTVKKQIGLAQENMELIEARRHVLRNALEGHYGDLCQFAASLISAFYLPASFGSTPGGLSDDYRQKPLFAALREHLPRSPLWKHIAAWDEACQAYSVSVQSLKERIWQEITASDIFTNMSSGPDMNRLQEAVEDDFGYHIMASFRGERGLRPGKDRGTDNLLEFRRVELSHLPKDKQAWLAELLVKAQEWDDFQRLSQVVNRLQQAKKDISVEVDILSLRRVLPGRCRYCPF
jgi:hypothetical protein